MQVAGVVKPVTVKLAGSASDAVVSSSTTVPEVQTRPTVTSAVLSSLKSLFTVNVAVALFTMVQLGVPPGVMVTPAQAVWFAV